MGGDGRSSSDSEGQEEEATGAKGKVGGKRRGVQTGGGGGVEKGAKEGRICRKGVIEKGHGQAKGVAEGVGGEEGSEQERGVVT